VLGLVLVISFKKKVFKKGIFFCFFKGLGFAEDGEIYLGRINIFIFTGDLGL
jgi:hypothetical protein